MKHSTHVKKNCSLILGFFDGIHLGHKQVIKAGVDFAKKNNLESILITFTQSPAEYFNKDFEYIFPRNHSYDLIKKLGVDHIYEYNFSELATISAEDYLKHNIIETFEPKAITTGFNHTFGFGRKGNPKFLEDNQKKYGYKYFCIPAYKINDTIISSTTIKKLLSKGDIQTANKYLDSNFIIESTVIEGNKIGRTLGFPTANMIYPKDIIKLPYGVYKVQIFDKPAILNWGIKPTIGNNQEILEVHIPNFDGNLYNQTLQIEFIKKIRDEQKFDNLNKLKQQISKDIKECLK